MRRSALKLLLLVSALPGQCDWAERVLEGMTLEEKVGQLFIVPACQLGDAEHREDLYRMIETYRVGGILLKQGTIPGQIALIQELQQRSSIPLLCVQDAEWGVAMRLSDAVTFPRNLTLGAITDSSLIYRVGKEIGRQCRLSGIHLNLAPVADVNVHPKNPIIHMRSFGDQPDRVATCATLLMQGIQSEGVIACGKHFPGHGDTAVDSHSDLPIIRHSRERLEQVEWPPFRALIQAGVGALMSAHLSVPALEDRFPFPATFSASVLACATEMGFNGLWITDALNMRAVARYFTPEETALLAHAAGNDLLLYGDHIAPHIDQILRDQVPRAVRALVSHYSSEGVSTAPLDAHLLKILRAKEKVCFQSFSLSMEDVGLKRELYEGAITQIHARPGLLPLKEGKVALICSPGLERLAEELKEGGLSVDCLEGEEEVVSGYDCVVLALSGVYPWEEHSDLAQRIQQIRNTSSQVIALLFDSPYCVPNLLTMDALFVGYEPDEEAERAMAQVLLGKLPPKGMSPLGEISQGM